MLVFWKERLAFLAVPKTGTTALEAVLSDRAGMVVREPAILKHTPVHKFNGMIRPYLKSGGIDNMEVMAIVRHPVSWLGSWYRYRLRDDLVGHPNSTRGIAFDTFVNEFCKGKPAEYAKLGNPSVFLRKGNGQIGVDHLFQYEQMDQAIAFLEERLEMEIALPQLNVSPPAKLALSEKTESKLERKHAEFYALWHSGYRA